MDSPRPHSYVREEEFGMCGICLVTQRKEALEKLQSESSVRHMWLCRNLENCNRWIAQRGGLENGW